MKCVRFLLILLLLLTVSSPKVQAFEFEQIDDIVKNDPVLKGAVAGISIRSARTGEILYEHSANMRLRPASNMKIFTAAAALSVLGEEYTFATELFTDGKSRWKVLNGNLYIKGNGDPTLRKEDIDQLVEELKSQGIHLITGDLIVDDTRYDAVRYPIDVPWSDEEAYYGAQISALTVAPDHDYDSGTVIVKVTPAKKIGEKAIVSVDPMTDYVTVINETTTGGSDEEQNLKITREHGTNTIQITGVIPLNAETEKKWVAVWEPTMLVLSLFKQALQEQEITLLGDIRQGEVPENARQLASHRSMPLSKIIIPFMKLSNNAHAETFIKELGVFKTGEGNWAKGLDVLKEELKQWNINTEALVLRDGSGISHVSGVPANQMTQLLYEIQAESWFSIFLESLPLVGGSNRLDRGTLYSRMSHTKASGQVRAKTGTLTTVSSLSGYIQTPQEENLIFSMILNQVLDEKQAKDLEDRLVLTLING